MAKAAAERRKEYGASREFPGKNGEQRVTAYDSTRANPRVVGLPPGMSLSIRF